MFVEGAVYNARRDIYEDYHDSPKRVRLIWKIEGDRYALKGDWQVEVTTRSGWVVEQIWRENQLRHVFEIPELKEVG